MSLVTLPRELLDEVCSLDILSRQDIKSLRLTCRQLAIATAPILFYCIRISPLLRDFQNFFSISTSTHLAPLVRVIVWEELGFDFSHLKDPSWKRPLLRGDGDDQFFIELIEFTYFLFLLDIQHISDHLTIDKIYRIPGHFTADMIHDNERLIPQSNIQDDFVSAVRNNMPNVNTLASRPMDIQRRLQVPSLDYSISVDGLRNLLWKNGTTLRLKVGFTDFLLPLLESLTTQAKDKGPASKITRLLYADEDVRCLSGLHRMAPLKLNLFEHLLHLDLCLSCNYDEGYAPRGFTACLANARSLETFKICNEQVLIPCSPSIIPTLPKLANVEFVEMNLIGRPEDPLISETVDLIRRHAKTLKRLCFTSSVVNGFFLAELSNLNLLQLERFVIASEDDTDDDYDNVTNNGSESHGENMHGYIIEQAVLTYFNRADDPNQEKSLPTSRFRGEETQISTHTLIFDTATCERAALHATRDNLWKGRGYDLKDVKALDSATLERSDEHGIAHNIGPRRIYHFETGLWVDSDEIFYDPVADEDVDDTFEKREPPKDDSWTIQGQRTWDSGMGLWRDGDGKLKKFATERELPERPEVPDEDEDSDFNIDMQPFYDREEDKYLLRIENSPRWDWGRDAQGEVWYWQVSGTAGHATEIWRFEHKGEYAYGNEPLDFWDDWYDDRGDKAEATPYGWNLVAFSECHELGSEIPQRGTCESLRRYSIDDDPVMSDVYVRTNLPKPADFEMWSNVSWCELRMARGSFSTVF